MAGVCEERTDQLLSAHKNQNSLRIIEKTLIVKDVMTKWNKLKKTFPVYVYFFSFVRTQYQLILFFIKVAFLFCFCTAGFSSINLLICRI